MSEPPPNPMPPPAAERKPWPIKWVFYAVLIYALLQMLYLFLTTRNS